MSTYSDQLKQLNTAQTRAVNTLDGPLLVLAGPGTGKTTLLATRAAHILEQTDTIADSILCLTFTESAQLTMQTRLVNLIGEDAYKIHVHTFHSFGSWVVRMYPQYFEQNQANELADDVTRYQVFQAIFERLDHHDPLASINDGDFLYLKDAMGRIGQLKQAAVGPQDLAAICKIDQLWVTRAQLLLKDHLAELKSVSKSSVSLFNGLCEALEPIRTISQIGNVCYLELRDALEESQSGDTVNTKPITAWKNSWLIKTGDGVYVLKYFKTLKKLQSLASVYKQYEIAMKQRKLNDYDDQLMVLIHALQDDADLRAELQERFLYIMADEYQDTNGAQQKILEQIADNPIHDGSPNLMVVGDDDQAIYGFQGAYSSNILDFLQRWKEVQTITLTENYRSTPEIVALSRTIITQGEDRLENQFEYIDKLLTTPNSSGSAVTNLHADTQIASYHAIVADIKQHIDAGVAPEQIAVIAPKHRFLEQFVPYATQAGVGVAYERRQNVLEEQHIYELCLLSEVVSLLSNEQYFDANTRIAKLLSISWWNINSTTLWDISIDAHKRKLTWLEVMKDSNDEHVANTARWLIKQASDARSMPLEQMLDQLIGTNPESSAQGFTRSPYYTHYFVNLPIEKELSYLLTSLISVRRHIRNYVNESALTINDFVTYINLRKQTGLPIINDHPLTTAQHSIHLMTAHKAKGLEFDIVYILDTSQSVWGKSRGRPSLISVPPHIAAVPIGDTTDEYLRLFYVALTRSAQQLIITSYSNDGQGNPVLPLGWLEYEPTKVLVNELPAKEASQSAIVSGLTFEWHENIMPHADSLWRDKLRESIKNYRLSPTHFNTFLDVTNGGPRAFLINHLLKFPSSSSPNAAFGNAMHHTMQFLHQQMIQEASLPNRDTTIAYFAAEMQKYRLGDIEEAKQTNRGKRALESLYSHGLHLFKQSGQISELDLSKESLMIGHANVTGKIDILDTEDGLIGDYKTGKPVTAWPKAGSNSYDALKLYKYRQQLLFYKLMLSNSETYKDNVVSGAQLIFLESAEDASSLSTLKLEYDVAELERLQKLIQVVWKKITNLDMPDVTKYPQTSAGIREFEDDLLAE